MAAANGLNTVTLITPMAKAQATTGIRNCHTETPAARTTISSRLRLSFQNTSIDPKRTAKGVAFSAMWGSLCRVMPSTALTVAASFPDVRRNISINSTSRRMVVGPWGWPKIKELP